MSRQTISILVGLGKVRAAFTGADEEKKRPGSRPDREFTLKIMKGLFLKAEVVVAVLRWTVIRQLVVGDQRIYIT